MNCKQVAQELLAARRGESDRQSEVYAHLADCADCRELADRMSKALSLLDAVGDFRPSERPWASIRRELVAEGAIAAKHITKRPFDLHKRIPPTFRYVAAVVIAAAAVAVLVHSQMPWKDREVLASAGTSGLIHVKRAGEGPWEQLGPGGLMRAGDRVATSPDAAGEVRLASGVSLKLNRRTLLELFDPSRLYMYTGEVYVVARPGGNAFAITTDAGSVTVAGTRFTVMVDGESTRVTVIEGEVELRGSGGWVSVQAGQAASVEKGSAPRDPVATDAAKAIGWALDPAPLAPRISLSVPSRKVRAGSQLVGQVTVLNPTREPVSIYAPGGAQPFYMFRIKGPGLGNTWVSQASPLQGMAGASPGDPATISLDPGGKRTFRFALPKIGAAAGDYSVSAIYYAYSVRSTPKWLWTGTIESEPVTIEVTGAR